MKKYYITILVFILFTGFLYSEVELLSHGAIYKNYTTSIHGNNVVKDGNRLLLIESYGVTIYEITGDELTEVASYNLPMVFRADLYGDKMVLAFENAEGDALTMDSIIIYDISNIEQPEEIHQIYTNFSYVYLKNDVIILGFSNQILLYSIDTLELLSTYQDMALYKNVEDSDYFTIKDNIDENHYLCYINNENQIEKTVDLGVNAGRVHLSEDLLLYCYYEFIDFYTVADSISYERTFNLGSPAYTQLSGVNVFENTLIVPIYLDRFPEAQKLVYYDISDFNNIEVIANYEFFPDLGNHTWFSVYDSTQWGSNLLYIIGNYGVIYGNYNNPIDEDNLLKYTRNTTVSNLIDNYLYLNIQNVIGLNYVYDVSDINNINQIETQDSLGTLYWFSEEENQFVVKKNLIDETLNLYTFTDNNFQYVDSYQISGFVQDYQINIDILLWNGIDLVYSFFQNIYWVRYENGSFSNVNVDEVYEPTGSIKWFYYNNYFYKATYSGLIKVYSIQENELVLENTLNWAYNNNSYLQKLGIKDGLLTIGNGNPEGVSKIYDLDVDPVNLTAEIDLNPYLINSLVRRYGDYYFYTGCDNENSTPYSFFENLSYCNIYKKVGDEFVKVGDIYNNRQTWDLEIIAQDENNFTLFLCSTRGVDVYSCHATPNGDLEITPVTLQATNYPNPFNPETTISYDIAQKGSVTVDIYNLKGQKVKSLVNENKEAGTHSVIWQGDNDDGKQVSSGTYFYKIKSADQEVVKKMMMVK
ncbi:MAG: FlgD immunoglobulin-like domain containing protein [Candidatus Cloacimonadales bacterium]